MSALTEDEVELLRGQIAGLLELADARRGRHASGSVDGRYWNGYHQGVADALSYLREHAPQAGARRKGPYVPD